MTVSLQIENIHTYYGNSHVLQGVSLEADSGRVVGLLGRNGMGKTTFMHSIIGFTPPRRGRISLSGSELTGLKPFQIARHGISLVPQGRQIFPSLSVNENLTVGQASSGDWNIERIFELFPPLRARAKNGGDQLSGGEQQMLAIGRCLMTNPSVLLMDEPTEGLSPLFVQIVGSAIDLLKAEGMAIILVEQNINFALRHSDVVNIMNKGQIVHTSLPEDLATNEEIKLRFLGI